MTHKKMNVTCDAHFTLTTDQTQQLFEFKYTFINSIRPRKPDWILGTSDLIDSLQLFKLKTLNLTRLFSTACKQPFIQLTNAIAVQQLLQS